MLAEFSERPLEQIFPRCVACEPNARERVEIGNLLEVDVRVRGIESGHWPIGGAERANSECKPGVAAVKLRSGVGDLKEVARPVQRSEERREPIVVNGCNLTREIAGEVVAPSEEMEHTGKVAVAAELPLFLR